MTTGPELRFADFAPGRVFELGTTVVDREEMVAFARRFDPQPFHVDEQAAAASIFGGLAASGWFTAGLWMRAYVDSVLPGLTGSAPPAARHWPGLRRCSPATCCGRRWRSSPPDAPAAGRIWAW